MKKLYQAPRIVDEQICEAHAMSCNKTPNVGSPCGPVWLNSTGNSGENCEMNPNARSS